MATLDEAQTDLLVLLCEAARRQAKSSKESFLAIETMGGPGIHHPLLPGGEFSDFHWPDLETLYEYGLIRGRAGKNELIFDVSPAGFEHFDKLMRARGEPSRRVEGSVRQLLDSGWFASAFPDAFASWQKAEGLYWQDHFGEHATAIGHHCREAMQRFGAGFAVGAGVAPGSAEKTLDNVRSGLGSLRGERSKSRLDLLDALLHYWGCVIDVVQRQEHGDTKEGDPLTHEDSRLVVFQTALVMFELASVLRAESPQ